MAMNAFWLTQTGVERNTTSCITTVLRDSLAEKVGWRVRRGRYHSIGDQWLQATELEYLTRGQLPISGCGRADVWLHSQIV